jgi:predicted component of type VI protein secretion system
MSRRLRCVFEVIPRSRCLTGCLLLAVLTGCGIQFHAEDPYIGPISQTGSSGPSSARFFFRLTSTTNCYVPSTPLTVTMTLTNTNTQVYAAALPVSVFDLQANTILDGADTDLYWSDTVPVAHQFRDVHLEPQEAITIEWPLHAVPDFNTVSGYITIRPVFSVRDSRGQIRTYESGEYLDIPVGSTPSIGSCAAAQQ